MTIHFCKFEGAGNDFVLINNLSGKYNLSESQIATLCHRRFGIGADGLICLSPPHAPFAFSMLFYNADGKQAAMCGNGGRCLVAFAHYLGLPTTGFQASDGAHTAQVISREGNRWTVQIQISDIAAVTPFGADAYTAHPGVPHLVRFVEDVKAVNVAEEGAYWRWHPSFPEGTNVNFVQVLEPGHLYVRTFERGVEGETWACGTGSSASAVCAAVHTGLALTHWDIETLGGPLSIDFERKNDAFGPLFLTGGAHLVFEGEVEI